MDWNQLLTILFTIPALFLWNRSESNAARREIMTLLKVMEQEMKDLHTKLATQDLEFKEHLKYLHSEKLKQIIES